MSYPYKSQKDTPKQGASQQSHRDQSNLYSPSQMQVGFPNAQEEETSQKTVRGAPQNGFQPSQKKVDFTIEEIPSSEFQRPQAQIGFARSERQNQGFQASQGQSQRYTMGQSQRSPMGQSQRDFAMQSQRNTMGQNLQHTVTPARNQPASSRFQPTVMADARPSGHSVIIRPGEPHHFGCSPDTARGEYLNTLCRCNKPMSHGDAYTMCDSPRGFDLAGRPIDWQTAKMRMLDFYGRDQISHQEEIAAIPHIFHRETAAHMMQNEEELKMSVRGGYEVSINTQGNNVTWHNEDGHAKPHATADGLKTKIDRNQYYEP